MGRPKGSKNSTGGKSDGIAPYFKAFYKENRKLLKVRSNKAALAQWLEDHPGYDKVPSNVRTGLANVKSELRSRRRKRRTKEELEAAGVATVAPMSKKPKNLSEGALEKLEIAIDDCMTMASNLNREALEDVLQALRAARRRVVLKSTDKD